MALKTAPERAAGVPPIPAKFGRFSFFDLRSSISIASLKTEANAIVLPLAITKADRLNVQQIGIGGRELHTIERFVEIGMPVA